jgi:hypothetical protein
MTMAGQIMFFEKSKCDFSNPAASASASQASEYAYFALNRSNRTAWVTTGSVDADNTTFTVDFTEQRYIDSIFLVKVNFKSYTLKYWNGSSYVDFATAIDVTNNTDETILHQVAEVLTSRLRLTIRGTMTANQDKYMHQFIATSLMGRLNAWPQIKKPTHDVGRIVTKMLSGKVNVTESVGGFRCDLEVANWKDQTDLNLVERLYTLNEGFLVWLCGGDESQFAQRLMGYRKEDIFLMRPTNNYIPEHVKGIYTTGVKLVIPLAECAQ